VHHPVLDDPDLTTRLGAEIGRAVFDTPDYEGEVPVARLLAETRRLLLDLLRDGVQCRLGLGRLGGAADARIVSGSGGSPGAFRRRRDQLRHLPERQSTIAPGMPGPASLQVVQDAFDLAGPGA
jgi:hypothetical protein